ncbi:Ku domain-containing protein [Mycena indigotica]|uniref:ATP-dependent DNA helicase II subunit 2 n=1 Tax=Mycena indigotica TaxID=2126181 RepID=A0A8H6WBI6_9AGAR|nr:Ku domain-containing protein [Mycena indigotica]KAF7306399.1 Ku domain-containing protein [Mycena indigotica]
MPAERAGYTVTMFIVDVGPSMNKIRTHDAEGNELPHETTYLQWGLQFVKLKIQEMIFNGRKTDQCGVILLGSDRTRNTLNKAMKEGYERIEEYIKIGQPTPATLSKLDALTTTDEPGDALDALIVAMETQEEYLGNKKTWTRKMVLVTDGESPIEVDSQLKPTVKKINAYGISLTIIGLDFDSDDENYLYREEDKSRIKSENEEFFKELVEKLDDGIVGTCAYALREISRPDVKITKSVLMGTTLRLGDFQSRPEEAIQVNIRTSKCTAMARPKSFKKFALREPLTAEQKALRAQKKAQMKKKKPVKMEEDDSVTESDDDDEQPVKMEVDEEEPPPNGVAKTVKFAQLKMHTQFYVDRRERNEDDDTEVKQEEKEPVIEDEDDEGGPSKLPAYLEQVSKEELIKGFKYGTTYVPCPDGQFERLPTKKGIDVCGFFPAKNFRRELSMGEVQYIWGDPSQPEQQVAISSIAQAMYEKNVMAIARWVSKDGMDPKMGVLTPGIDDGVDYLLWSHMPFADDVRKYMFASLDKLVSKKGEILTEHPFLPTEPQLEAMDDFVDAMDLMHHGDKDEEGNRGPWFDTRLSYNPAVHRIKQAQFHAAVVSDINTNPVPPPHPELLTYFDPPPKMLKRGRDAIEKCKDEFKVKQVPKKVAKTKATGHAHAHVEEDEGFLLDAKPMPTNSTWTLSQPVATSSTNVSPSKKGKTRAVSSNGSVTEDDEDLLSGVAPRSRSPAASIADTDNATRTAEEAVDLNIDPGRAPGRIIGTTRPLADFRENIARGDVVSKAVEDLCAVIAEVVVKPFASRRHAELVECMQVLRDTCLKEDEVDAWNDFMRDLKKTLTKSSPGNKGFWAEIQKVGRPMSLISDKEAEEHGGSSDVSETGAKKFLN